MELRDKTHACGPPQCEGELLGLGHHGRYTTLGTQQIISGKNVTCHVGVKRRGGGRKGLLGYVTECVSAWACFKGREGCSGTRRLGCRIIIKAFEYL